MIFQNLGVPELTSLQQKQFAALPYVQTEEGPRVLLLTSRETKRWVVPKGWPIRGLKPHEVAEREALEEAGIRGLVSEESIGTYSYRKRLHYFSSITCEVEVFALLVAEQKLHWRERAQRQLVWLEPAEAALRVQEPELAQIFDNFDGH